MRATLILFRSFLKRDRTPLISLAALLFAFELLIIWLARVLDAGGTYQNLIGIIPDFVENLVGFDVTALLSFSGGVALGYFHPIVITSLMCATIVAARGPISEVESRTAELLLARALPRRGLALASLLEVATVSTALPLAMMLGSFTGLALVGRLGSLPLTPYVLLCLNGAALALAAGAIYVLIATLTRRLRVYFQMTIGFAIVSYLVHYLARLWTPLGWLDPLSLFHYIEPITVLAGQGVAANIAMLGLFAVVSGALAVVISDQREL